MNKLRFKTFTWPNNPERCRVETRRAPQYDPETGAFTGLGPICRTVTGSGAFFGDGAYENFLTLAKLLEDPTAGTLVHPVLGNLAVFFTGLALTQEPQADYAAYTFTFQSGTEFQ